MRIFSIINIPVRLLIVDDMIIICNEFDKIVGKKNVCHINLMACQVKAVEYDKMRFPQHPHYA